MCHFNSQKCRFLPRIALLLSQIALLSFRKTTLFPGIAFLFSTVYFCFPELPSFYLLCASFWKFLFFPTDCTVSCSCSELLREITFHLFLFCFLLGLFIDQLHRHPRFRGRCWMHDLQNGSYNYQETMFVGRWAIEHANESFFLFLMIFDRVFEYLEM